jgi:uncharacterized protein (TIGR02679 family)
VSHSPDARLQRLLGGEHLAPLRRRLRRHFERTHSDGPAGAVRLSDISAQEYATLASLMGRPTRHANSIRVDIASIDMALRRAEIALSLRAALEHLDGPIIHIATARAEACSRWSAVAAGCRHSALASYLQTASGLGVLKRIARQDPLRAARLRDRAEGVLRRLPADGLPRAQLAADALGDAHALDTGEPTATLVLAAWRHQDAACDGDEEAAPEDAHREESARGVWARAGVLVNELARPALFLNVPLGDGELPSPPGEPRYASLRMLLRSPPAWSVAGRDVFVCENPNVVAIAAERLGRNCAPLVSTDGMPAAAQRTLLAQLAGAGARLLYHGDFDWPGLRIANCVMRACGARPWRLGAEDYAAAVSRSPHREHQLSGAPATAAWDASLARVMRVAGLAIPEESVAQVLLGDLRR